MASQGIHTTLELAVCNLEIQGEFSEIMEEFIDSAKRDGNNRFLCVVSAVSGAKKEGLEKMHDAFKTAAAFLSHRKRSSSWLWVEPHIGKTWLVRHAESIRLTLQKIAHTLFPKSDGYELKTSALIGSEPESRRFSWLDPHNNHLTKSSVIVMAFKNK
jgi:hypothetical protein